MLLSAVKSDFITGNASSMAGMGYLEEVANPCCDRCWMELSASSHSTGELALHSQYHAVSTDERIGEPRSAIRSACRWGGSRERYWSLSWLLPFSRIKRANPDSRHYQATLMSALMFTRVASMDRSIEASKHRSFRRGTARQSLIGREDLQPQSQGHRGRELSPCGSELPGSSGLPGALALAR